MRTNRSDKGGQGRFVSSQRPYKDRAHFVLARAVGELRMVLKSYIISIATASRYRDSSALKPHTRRIETEESRSDDLPLFTEVDSGSSVLQTDHLQSIYIVQ